MPLNREFRSDVVKALVVIGCALGVAYYGMHMIVEALQCAF